MRFCFILLILFAVALPSYAATSLPLPRFVSVKSTEANVRNGPGLHYPIKWVIQRQGLPVEVVAEFEQWRKVRDVQNDEGWVHRSQLSGKRTVLITGKTQTVREDNDPSSPPVARMEAGVVADLLDCSDTACEVEADKQKGWIDRAYLWGIYPPKGQE